MTNVNLLVKATGLDDLQILGKELTLLQVGGSEGGCCDQETYGG